MRSFCSSGPSCSKLTMSLVNDSLKFTSSDTQICWNFLLKKMQKLLTFFSAKNIRILYTESAKTVNEMTLNELVKLTTLWTPGPRNFAFPFCPFWISMHTTLTTLYGFILFSYDLFCNVIAFQYQFRQITLTYRFGNHIKYESVHSNSSRLHICPTITKTRLCKYVENFTSKNWKFSDKNLWYFSYFCSEHRL